MTLQTEPDTRLRGRWLLVARTTWIVVALLGIGFLAAFAPLHLRELRAGNFSGGASFYVFYYLTLAEAHVLSQIGLSTDLYAAYVLVLEVVFVSLFCMPAVVIFWRKHADKMSTFVSFMLIIEGLFSTPITISLITMQTLWRYPVSIFIGLGPALLVFFAYLFPDGRFVPRWTRWPAIICGSLLPLGFVASSISPTMPVKYFYLVLVPLLLGNSPFAVYAQFYRYSRVSNTVQRQQTKWVLLGLLASALGMLALIFPLLIYPAVLEPGRAHVLYILFSAPVTILSLGVIPLSISLSILRYRLWDIDIIIRRTLVYSLLTALLALVYFSSIVLLQNLFAAFSGQRSELTIVASTLAIAALFTPLRRRVQDGIDRRFYRRKYDAAKTLATFSATVRDETNLDNLTGELLAVVQETMQPEHVSLWLRKEEVKRKA